MKIDEEEFDIIYSMHHIISDGWSVRILQKEFAELYETLKNDQNWILPELKIQYKDFAGWQNQLFADEDKMQAVNDFWSKQLEELPVLKLPTDFSESSLTSRDSAAYRFVIPEDVQKELKKIYTEYNASLFMLLLAGFNLLLTRITNQTDLVIGIPAAGRDHADLRNIIGFFINTVILRNKIDPEETFDQFLKRIQNDTIQALDYQSYPLELIVSRLKMDYPKISVFFNMLNLQNLEEREIESFEPYHIEKVQDVKFDLVLYLGEFSNGIEVTCHYLKGLFNPGTIEYIMGEYLKILRKMIENPDGSLQDFIAVKKTRRILF